MRTEELEPELETRVAAMDFELVELERAGSRARPIFRLRIDRPDSAPGQGVTVDDCSRVSRELEPYLDQHPDISERYVLEVSSPGVERPLVRRRDYERFAGHEVAVKGSAKLADRSRRLTGELLGIVDAGDQDGAERVRLRLEDGEVVEIARDEIDRAHLIFRWGEGG